MKDILKNKTGSLWLWLIAGPLLLYSAFRNGSLLITTVSAGSGIFGIVMVAAGLFALDIGVILWLKLVDKAENEEQSTIAIVLVTLDLIGVIVGMVADHILEGGGYVQFASLIQTVSWIAIPVLIGINVVGSIMYAIKDSDRKLEMERANILRRIEHKKALAELDLLAANHETEIASAQREAHDIRSRISKGDFGGPASPYTPVPRPGGPAPAVAFNAALDDTRVGSDEDTDPGDGPADRVRVKFDPRDLRPRNEQPPKG